MSKEVLTEENKDNKKRLDEDVSKNNNDSESKVVEKVIQTKKKVKDGQYVCPNCGSSEVEPNPKTGKLRCVYCASEFDGKEITGVENNLKNLKGLSRGSGTNNIKGDSSDVITLRCGGCGAEVVIDTNDATHARCHWCRSILGINSQIENGAVPDAILPFSLKKDEAQVKINSFVKSRAFFANPVFKREFTTENIMGVYFPYMLVDANCHAKFSGEGEHLVRSYTVGSGDDRETYYDADSYSVVREFDMTVDDLQVESNSNRLDKDREDQTNNIINSIMPFDTENCIAYESNYLVGYTSERRDINIENLEDKVNKQLKDIARYAAREDCKFYDRGVRWDSEELKVIGTQWLAAYLPVWLYSYQEVKGKKKVLHYVAVNARTGETMGSVPINQPLLIFLSTIIEIICGIVGLFLFIMTAGGDDDDNLIFLALFLGGFIFYGVMYARYRNQNARHTYEVETKKEVSDLVKEDTLIKHEKRLKNSVIKGRNDNKLEGDNIKVSSIIDNLNSISSKK